MSTLRMSILIFAAILFSRIDDALSHGRMIDPPHRSSKWRYGYDSEANYNDMELFCGGYDHQWNAMGGKCGACGDPYDAEIKENEDINGIYVDGIITGYYDRGSVLVATVELTAYHMGWFEFRLCALPNAETVVTQECLDQTLLNVENESTTRIDLNTTQYDTNGSNRIYNIPLQLPSDITCTNCVLQWKYNAGNNFDCDADGNCCKGCGPQENFVNCADIAILENETGTTSSTQSSSSSSQSATMSAITFHTTTTTNAPTTSSTTTISSTITELTSPTTTTSPSTTTTSPSTTTTSPSTTSSTTTTTSPTTTTTRTTSPSTTTTSPSTTTTTSPSTTTTATTSYTSCGNSLSCSVVYPFDTVPGMHHWCCVNCEQGYCPSSHCTCISVNN